MNDQLDTFTAIMMDGLAEDQWRAATPWNRVRMVYAALFGVKPPDESAIAAIVRETTNEHERMGLLLLLGPRTDILARMEHPDERKRAAQILQWMRVPLSPALAWILDPEGPPPDDVARHPILNDASPMMLASIIAPALVNAPHAPATAHLAARCLERIAASHDAGGEFGVGLARFGAWHALEQSMHGHEAFKKMLATSILGIGRAPERIVQCACHGVIHPLFLPALERSPSAFASVIRAAGAMRDRLPDDVRTRLIALAATSREMEPTLAAIETFGLHADLLATAESRGFRDAALQALSHAPNLTREDLDALADAPWEMAHRVGHHPILLANAITTRNAASYAVLCWDALTDRERTIVTMAAICEGNTVTLAQVPFEAHLPESLPEPPLPPLTKHDDMVAIVTALRARRAAYGSESLESDFVRHIRDALVGSPQGLLLWVAADLPPSHDHVAAMRDLMRTSAMDIARTASVHGWALSAHQRDAVIRAIIESGDPDVAANATMFLGWDRRLIDAALAPSSDDFRNILAPHTKTDHVARRALACIHGLVAANDWTSTPNDAVISLIATALRDPSCNPVQMIELCGPLPILTSHVLDEGKRSALQMRVSPVNIANALLRHGPIPPSIRDELGMRCPNNVYTATRLAEMIGHHRRLAQIARANGATDTYYETVFANGQWDDSLLDEDEARRRVGQEAEQKPDVRRAFQHMPLTTPVFLTALMHPPLLADRIAAGTFPDHGPYADMVRMISAQRSPYVVVTDDHATLVDVILSEGDATSRTAIRHLAPNYAYIISPTAQRHDDIAVHLVRLLQRPTPNDDDILPLISTLRNDAHGLELLLHVVSRVGAHPMIDIIFNNLSIAWRERYARAIGAAPQEQSGLGAAPLDRIRSVIAQRRR